MRQTSAKGIKLISQREANILHWYLDSSGYPTIGVGHLIKRGDPWKKGDTITMAESLALLKKDLSEVESAINHNVRVDITQNQFDALASLGFNIGTGALAHSSVVRALNAKHTKDAADDFLRWNKSAGHVVKGLVNRRRAERIQFLQPDNIVNHFVTVTAPAGALDEEPTHPIIVANEQLDTPTKVEEGTGVMDNGTFYGTPTATTVLPETPQPQIVEIPKQTPSLMSNIMAVITYLVGIGFSVGGFLQNRLEALTNKQIIVIFGFLGLAGLGMLLRHWSAERANKENIAMIKAAEDPTKNNPILTN
jgi:lysozyme